MTAEEKNVFKFKEMVIRELKRNHFRLHNRLNLSEYIINYNDPKNKFADYKNNGVAKDLADKMEASGEFNKEIAGVDQYWVVKNVIRGWAERNPVLDKVRTGFITALFSLLVGWLLFQLNNRGQVQIENKQNESLLRKGDSLKIFDNKIKALEDTLAKYKRH